MTGSRRRSELLQVEASRWLAIMSDRTVSLEDRGRFAAWLAANPEHERIYLIQKAAWSAIGRMSHLKAYLPRPEVEEESGVANRVRRSVAVRRWSAAAALLLVLGASLSLVGDPGMGVVEQVFATAAGETRELRMVDGSVVTLGPESRVDTHFSLIERRVRLQKGEAFFEVASEIRRPFVVAAGASVLRVLGTQFDVQLGNEAVRVAVVEGRVELLRATPPARQMPRETAGKRVLSPGMVAIADSAGVVTTAAGLRPRDLGAWRRGRLVYVDRQLADVVADINRYCGGRVRLASPSAGRLRLTAAFRVDQIDRALELLQGALPIEADHASDGGIVLRDRRPPP